MFGLLKKRNLALERCRAQFLIRRDLTLANRAHEDAQVTAKRRQEDWEMQHAFDQECIDIRERDNG